MKQPVVKRVQRPRRPPQADWDGLYHEPHQKSHCLAVSILNPRDKSQVYPLNAVDIIRQCAVPKIQGMDMTLARVRDSAGFPLRQQLIPNVSFLLVLHLDVPMKRRKS